ncbi:acyl-CoA amino acid n-acyltransferase 1 [Plakobranchus ocellatus]|uniref:Acyl-CoA amino acid n-acyltransferase 1 n=1 Tax=Plakobranchus ocellatus TaxID=259542 RepID=A0AAV3YX09_9GAST|nr:acyl-CoA amino acid n-acyltransferase 1 [Plakobranchus ocellatus]
MSKSQVLRCAQRIQTIIRHVSASAELSKASISSSSTTSVPSIIAEPKAALVDEEVKISLHNFPPLEKVTLHGHFEQLSSATFASCGHFVSNASGQVDVSNEASKGGTFCGVEPMGILWSLRAAPGHPQDTRMAINFTDRSCLVTLRAYLGHLDLEDIYNDQGLQAAEPLAELQLERFGRGAGVTRLEVQDGNIRGALYLPAGEGPFPAVIDMFGSSGGLIEYRSALLASRGFAALNLAYFKYKDLQTSLFDLRYEYFEEAINWLASHPKVISSGIGVIASSKGVENALIMGAYSPKVKAVVCINGLFYATVGNFLRNDEILLVAKEANLEKIELTEEGFDLRGAMAEPGEIIPVWQGNAKYLLLESQDDYQTKPNSHQDLLTACPAQKQKDIQVVQYPGAGHLLDPPYTPLCRSSLNKGIEESRKKGLELNSKKTEVMVISRKQESRKCDIFINEVKLKQTEKFKYLGTIISNDGKTNREISARTAQAKINFQKMKTILTNKHLHRKEEKSPTVLHRTCSNVWMRSMDNLKANSK